MSESTSPSRLPSLPALPALFGLAFFVGMMAIGYFYNVTFVQLGLLDLGTRLIGLSRAQVSAHMATFALLTGVVALLVGALMTRFGWGANLRIKLRLAFVVVAAQTVLTALAPHLRSQAGFQAWIWGASLVMGLGVPATFSMAVDFVPVRWRGLAAALITALAYFLAAAGPPEWRVDVFAARFLLPMTLGALSLGALAFLPLPFIDYFAGRHKLASFGAGRFTRSGAHASPAARRILVLVALMFGIYFIDSLGFLRIIDTPLYSYSAWQSPESGVRLLIAATHVITALIGGVLYDGLEQRGLFFWVFGIFGLVHMMYTFHNQYTPVFSPALIIPILYATAVSLYTVINFAVWADLSTPATVSIISAIGVAFSGWVATFISTSLAIRWQIGGMTIGEHLRIVDAMAIVFLLLTMLIVYLSPPGASAARQEQRP